MGQAALFVFIIVVAEQSKPDGHFLISAVSGIVLTYAATRILMLAADLSLRLL
jgi:hypothetical protein